MKGIAMAMLMTACAACAHATGPRVDADVRITPDGVRVHPRAGVRVGNVGVTVSP